MLGLSNRFHCGINFAPDFALKEPGTRPFYKYVSPATLLAILRNQTVKYSSPLTFNDPFDNQIGLHFGFCPDDLPSKIIKRYEYLAQNPEVELFEKTGPTAQLVDLIRKMYPSHGFPPQLWEGKILPILGEASRTVADSRREYQERWLASLEKTRIFCVAEQPDDLLMWAHYANEHHGAVLEIWSLPDDDNPLSVARKVEYVDAPPSFFTIEDFVDYHCGLRPLDINEHIHRSVYTKSAHWAYESEWRVYFPLSDSPGSEQYITLHQSELKAVYFGCNADPSFIADSTELLSLYYPSTRTLQASKRKSAYALRFSET